MDSDNVLNLEQVPRSMVIVGAGVIGMEYASMFAALGSKITVVEKRAGMLDFCDVEVIESLKYHLRDLAVTFRFGDGRLGRASSRYSPPSCRAATTVPADTVMYSAGRQGLTDELDLDKAGLSADPRGRIKVDENYRTEVPHIYAVGDVIGFPALAATSMEQGRTAAYHAFGQPAHPMHDLQPIGIYTIPEISFIGAPRTSSPRSACLFPGRHLPLPRTGPRPDHR